MDIGILPVDDKSCCPSHSSVGTLKILNMSNNVSWPTSPSFVSRSWRQNSSVSMCQPPIHQRPQYSGTTKDIRWPPLLLHQFDIIYLYDHCYAALIHSCRSFFCTHSSFALNYTCVIGKRDIRHFKNLICYSPLPPALKAPQFYYLGINSAC